MNLHQLLKLNSEEGGKKKKKLEYNIHTRAKQ